MHAFGDPYEPPSIEILIRNTGDLVSVISGLQVEILEYGHLRICEAGGGLDVSATYDLTLPAGAESVGQQLTADVSQQIQVGEADRFAFALTVPHEDIAEGAHLYRLALDLEHDAEETTLDVGTALISAPVPVDEWYVDEESAQLGGSVGECYAENIRIWDEFSRLEGERSTGMTSPIPH